MEIKVAGTLNDSNMTCTERVSRSEATDQYIGRLCHLLTVLLGVQRGFSEQHAANVVRWVHPELLKESMMPDVLHVFPVGYYPLLDGFLCPQPLSTPLSIRATPLGSESHAFPGPQRPRSTPCPPSQPLCSYVWCNPQWSRTSPAPLAQPPVPPHSALPDLWCVLPGKPSLNCTRAIVHD